MGSKSLHDISRDVPVTDFMLYRDYLKRLYDTMKREDNSYSYPQLAQDLGFSRTNVLWLVIANRRKLSMRAATRIITALKIKGLARRYFLALVRHNNARTLSVREEHLTELVNLKTAELPDELGRTRFEYFSQWYHPVIRELTGLSSFKVNADWISKHLYATLLPKEIEKSLKLLETLELIFFDASAGRYLPNGGQVRPDRKVSTIAAIRYHQKMLDMAREAITRVPAKRRDINALTIRISDACAEQAKAILQKACEQILKLEEVDYSTVKHVYQINSQLFPFTRELDEET